MANNKYIKTGFAIAGVLMLAAYISGLFVDLTGDASKYGAIARHIVDSGDWINLKIHGEPYEQKPPLLFWLAAFGLKIGGLHNWSFKLFPVLYSLAGFYFTYKLAEILYNKNTAKLAVLLLSTSWIYFFFTADIHTDLVLQANTTLAIWQFAAYLKTQKTSHFVWAFVAIGLAVLTKGVVGAAVPAFALGAQLLFTKNYRQLFHPKWLLGIVIVLLINIPTFWGLYQQFGLAGFKFFFITNNIGRITGEYIGSNNDYFYYLHTMAYLLQPWTFLWLFSFWYEIKSYFSKSAKKREYFTVGAIWMYLLIISIARAKVPHYIFMIVPLIFIVVAHWLDEKMQQPEQRTLRWLTGIQTVIPMVLLALLVLIISYLFPTGSLWIWIFVAVSFGTSVFFYLTKKELQIRLLLPSAIMMLAFVLVMNLYTLPVIASYQASSQASRIFNNESLANDQMYNYLFPYYEVYFYTQKGAEPIYTINEFNPEKETTSWIFTTEEGKDSLLQVFPEMIQNIDTLKHQGMSRLRPRFFNPSTRKDALETTYLIQLGAVQQEKENF